MRQAAGIGPRAITTARCPRPMVYDPDGAPPHGLTASRRHGTRRTAHGARPHGPTHDARPTARHPRRLPTTPRTTHDPHGQDPTAPKTPGARPGGQGQKRTVARVPIGWKPQRS